MEKSALLALIREKLAQQADTCRKEMQLAQESANSEEKSSAGDKYETGRAMSQQQRDFFAKRLDAAVQEMAVFDALSKLAATGKIQAGSLLKAGNQYFFVGSGIGLLSLPSGEKLICTSTDSPLGKSLLGKKPGDEFSFTGSFIRIESLE
jgi:hypothetical protein